MPDRKSLVVGISSEFHDLDPKVATDFDSSFIVRQIFDPPFGTVPGTTEIEPVLFREGLERERRDDPSRLRARVRDDVLFSDGSAMSARDVAQSLSQAGLIRQQAEVGVDGDWVTFTLKRPNSRFDLSLSHHQSSVLQRRGDQLLGTGAFQLAPKTSPTELRLTRNPHHRSPAALDEILFKAYPLDELGRPMDLLRAVQNREVDFSLALARDEINQLTGVRKSIQPGASTGMLYLNCQSPKLADPRLRRALAHSIDRFELAKALYSNALAFAASSMLPRTLGIAELKLDHDPARAAALLAETGVEKPQRLTLALVWGPRPYLPRPQLAAEILRDQIGRLGIDIEIVPTSSATEFIGRMTEGDYDLTLAGWVADTMDPADFFEANLGSDRIPGPENLVVAFNNGRLVSAEMDAALAAYRAKRDSQSLEELSERISLEAPLVPLIYGASTTIWAYRVRNFRASPLALYPLASLDLED